MQNRVKHRLLFVAPLFALSVLVCSLVGIHDALAVEPEKEITMFIPDIEWPPYIINDPSRTDEGALVEIFKAAVEPLGYHVTALQLPDKRGWEQLRSGKVDVHIKAREWVSKPDEYLWSAPFMQSEDVLVFRKGSSLSYAEVEDLYGKSVAAMEGFVYPGLEPYFYSGQITRVDSASPYTMLELLALGRVDAALVNRSETQWLFRTRPDLKPERFCMDDTPCASAFYRYVFTKDEKWLPVIKKLDARLVEMRKSGELKAILDQYK